jgi:hypothetical protein
VIVPRTQAEQTQLLSSSDAEDSLNGDDVDADISREQLRHEVEAWRRQAKLWAVLKWVFVAATAMGTTIATIVATLLGNEATVAIVASITATALSGAAQLINAGARAERAWSAWRIGFPYIGENTSRQTRVRVWRQAQSILFPPRRA